MNKTELTKLNVGYNLDWLMNLDPRGYGVCRILYDGASKYTGKPLSLNGAQGLVKNIKKGEKVFILTGFILLPWNEAETDGIISSTVFARFVIRAFGAKPVMIVPEQCEKAIKAMSEVLGVNVTYEIYYGNEETPTDSNKMIAQNGQIGGTVGKSLAIKNVKLSIDSVPKISGSIVYNGHRQTYGDYNSDVQAGQTMCINCQGKSNYGTGEKRLEQIKIKLTGEVAYYFDVYYRVHIRREGWLGTVSNDQWTGSSGLCKRVEAIEIKVVPKGSEIPKFSNGGSNVVKTKIHYTKGDSNVTNNCPPEQEYVCTKDNYSYNGFDTYEGWSVERCKKNQGLCVIGTTSGGNCSCRIYSTKTGSRNVCKWVQKK